MLEEQVLVIPNTPTHLDQVRNLTDPLVSPIPEAFFCNRKVAEETDTIRQVIPYVSIVTGQNEFLVYQRTEGGNEKGLHLNTSIGVGGHIDQKGFPFSPSFFSPVLYGIMKELSEELDFSNCPIIELSYQGTIILDTTPVDTKHLGLWFQARIPSQYVSYLRTKEPDKIQLQGFIQQEHILSLFPTLESWSLHVLKS